MLKPSNCALLTKNIPVLITVLPHRPAGRFPRDVWLSEQMSSQIKHWWRGKVRARGTIIRQRGQSLIWPLNLKPTGGWLLMWLLITNTRSFKSRWAYHRSPESWRQIWERNGWANKLFLTFYSLFFLWYCVHWLCGCSVDLLWISSLLPCLFQCGLKGKQDLWGRWDLRSALTLHCQS